MTYGYCFAGPGSSCSGKAQPGTIVLRDTIRRLIPEVGDLGIYNCRSTRTGSNLSLHGVGRAWDAATSTLDLNRKLAEFFVAASQDLGVQRVIAWGIREDGTTGPREWDSRVGERVWERYSGPTHRDHNHVELCIHAAQSLTKQQVEAAFKKHWKQEGLMIVVSREEFDALREKVDSIWTAVYERLEGKTVEATDQLRDKLDEILAEVRKP